MKKVIITLAVTTLFALSACKPSGNRNGKTASDDDANLECAALISAANRLMVTRKVETDPAFSRRALVTSMTYLNAYSVPKGLKEKQSFAEVKALRATLLETLSPAEIITRAKRCVNRSPL